MNKLKMPKNPYKGLKIYCNVCKKDSPKCSHYDMQIFRVRIHVPNTKYNVKVRVLKTRVYEDAVKEAIDFRKELVSNNYETIKPTIEGNDYSLPAAILKYNQYLEGNHPLAQKKKIVSKDYQDECVRYCTYFAESVKKTTDINRLRIVDINKYDVSAFYSWAKNHYQSKTFNKCMMALKAFFEYLIKDEEVIMKNPFDSYVALHVTKGENLTLTQNEFLSIYESVDIADPIKILGGKGEKKNMYKDYLKDGFKMMLLTGGRREEVLELRWSDIFITNEGVRFFRIHNRKVERIHKQNDVIKYIPINADLQIFLEEKGYSEKQKTNDYIFYNERTEKIKTLMDSLSKSFTHYKKACNIEKNVSMKNLRKTYITWVETSLGKNTGKITSHSEYQVLKDYYLDPTVISAIEKVALETRVFGPNSAL